MIMAMVIMTRRPAGKVKGYVAYVHAVCRISKLMKTMQHTAEVIHCGSDSITDVNKLINYIDDAQHNMASGPSAVEQQLFCAGDICS